jgi:predicted dehydrogenase
MSAAGQNMSKISKPVEIALVGPGRMGRIYARLIEESATARLVAVCGRREEPTQALAQLYGVPGYADGDYAAMLADHPIIDAVIVACSEWAHTEPVLAALAAGKQVLVEKPMAVTVADGAEMVRLAKQNQRNLIVCHSLRFDPRFAALQQAVGRGALGEVLHLYARRNAPQMAVERVLGRFPLAFWLAPHDIDMMLWSIGSKVAKVQAFARHGGQARADFIIAVLTFANGAIGVVESSWGTPAVAGQLLTEQFSVRGAAGAAEVLGNQAGVAIYQADSAPDYPDTGYTPVIHGQQDGMFRRLFDHFVGVVQGRWPPLITGRDGLAVLQVADAITRSLDEQREIVLSLGA